MADYLKKSNPPVEVIDTDTGATVQRMLAEIEVGGEEVVRRYARDLDGWQGDIVLSEDTLNKAANSLSDGVKQDICYARDRVCDFAKMQRESLHEFRSELRPGLIAGQKLIPVQTAGCYVPGGRYAHAASAVMSVGTAKIAGVQNVIATSPAHKDVGVNPAIFYAMQLCGADKVLALGGVQAVASLAYGLFTGNHADVIVGPGNRFVAEAKRTLPSAQGGLDVLENVSALCPNCHRKAHYG